MGDALRYMVDYLFPITNPVHEPEVKLWTHKLGTNDGQQNYTTRRL